MYTTEMHSTEGAQWFAEQIQVQAHSVTTENLFASFILLGPILLT
jgi:hypothetical protein